MFSEISDVIQMSVQIVGALPYIDAIALSPRAMLPTRIGTGRFVVSRFSTTCPKHAFISILIFIFVYQSNSGDLEVTVEFLVEMDKLVQLIESPIFACKFSRRIPDAMKIVLSFL